MVKIRWLLFGLCAAALFTNLGKPYMWQDEAETALHGRSVLIYGYPNVHLGGNLITAQPSLQQYESAPGGAWRWNTWLPCYLPALSYKIFGESTFAARFPFAIFGLIAFWLASILFREAALELKRPQVEIYGLLLLSFSVSWLMLMRQCRYYSLISAGTLAAVLSYRLLIKGSKIGPPAFVASLVFLLLSFFVSGPLLLVAFAIDAALRGDDREFQKRFALCAAVLIALAAPVAVIFKIWSRPGNHSYPIIESLAFMRTFLLSIHDSLAAGPILLAAAVKKWPKKALPLCGAYLVFLLALCLEGTAANFVAAAIAAGLTVSILQLRVPKGETGFLRLGLIVIFLSLWIFSFTASEPWVRYLVALIPFFCLLLAAAIDEVGGGRPGVGWAICIALICGNFVYVLPVKALSLAAPVPPHASVSGMMRRRVKDTPFRSDPFLFAREIMRGSQGYVEGAADYVDSRIKPGETGFSDADNLSYMFYTQLRMIGPAELDSNAPDWIFPSRWLELNPKIEARIAELVRQNPYEEIRIDSPNLLWQNNPDLFYHLYEPRIAPRIIYHLKSKEKT